MEKINKRMQSFYFDVCRRIAKLSRAKKLKVGSLIVKNGNIIAYGWNGTPYGWSNECEILIDGELKTKPEVIHSEKNSLYKLAKSGESSDGAVIFCTHAPCLECAKAIFMSGITSFFYESEYRSNDGLEFLQKCGVEVVKRG